MTTEIRSHLGFPRLAIAEGATTPDPGIAGVLAWSTTLSAMVRWSGSAWNEMASASPTTESINDLTADTTPADGDFLALWDLAASQTKKLALSVLSTFLLGAIIRADSTRTLSSSTSAQAIFNSPASGQITLATGTYEFEALICIASMSATSGNATFSLAGTATLGSILQFGAGRDAAADAATGTLAGSHSRDATLVGAPLVTAATAAEMFVTWRGTFEVTAGGTVIPRVALQTAAAAVVQIGSFFKVRRLGDTSLVSSGDWS